MSDDDAFLAPPPGLLPVPPKVPEAQPEPEGPQDLIGPPPGMADLESATYRIDAARRSAPVRTPVAASAPVFVPTVVPGLPVPGVAVPAPAAQQPAAPQEIVDETRVAPRRDTTTWNLALQSGETHRFAAGTVLVGRGPAVLPGWPGAQLLAVTDPSKSVSKTHAAIEIDAAGRLRLHDLDSTNGVWVSYPNGDESDVESGTPCEVEDGATIHLGQFAIRVQRG